MAAPCQRFTNVLHCRNISVERSKQPLVVAAREQRGGKPVQGPALRPIGRRNSGFRWWNEDCGTQAPHRRRHAGPAGRGGKPSTDIQGRDGGRALAMSSLVLAMQSRNCGCTAKVQHVHNGVINLWTAPRASRSRRADGLSRLPAARGPKSSTIR